MQVKVGKRTAAVTSLAEASRTYCKWRGDGEKMRRMRNQGQVVDGGKVVATISHNGKVWAPGPWYSGKTPLFDPNA